MITAPFNFVPLSEEVFFPDWANDVSHDIPFEDSQSGVIDIKLTAKSPIFIRDNKDETKFCNHDGEYYIPSTSVKGMVRSVLEIISFSKMSQFDDDTYAVRDLNNSDLYMNNMKPANILCGWLKQTQEGYVIEDCGRAGRIKHEEIDKIFGIDFASQFKKGTFSNKPEDKTAKKKYSMIDSSNFTYNFKYTKTSSVGDKRYVYDKSSSTKGTIVLTGQPSGRDDKKEKPDGKVYEFLFFEPKKEILLSEKVMKNFLFAYFDGRTTEPKESPDWEFWKKRLEDGEKVPVFFQKDGDEVAHFGLSYLYKLPYNYSVEHGIPQAHKDTDQLDLAQTIFGYVGKDKALKGRVQFSHFKAISNAKESATVREVLGSPRASYYPIYVKQDNGKYKTFMNDKFSISGWKRYPIHKGIQTYKLPTYKNGKVNEKVITTFTPLNDGVVFEGKLRYHNLKKIELGAILSALTFHNNQDDFYHNIGMAKSLGFGKITLTLDTKPYLKFLQEFEMMMQDWSKSKIQQNWIESSQIKELFVMAYKNLQIDDKLEYLKLDPENNIDEFTSMKKNKNCLPKVSQLFDIKDNYPKTLLTPKILEEMELIKQKQKDEKALQDELAIAEKSENIQLLENFIKKHPEYENIAEVIEKKESLQKAQESNKHEKVNDDAQKAWDGIHNPKYAKGLQKSLQSFIKKWDKKNKGSAFVLELIEKAKQELK